MSKVAKSTTQDAKATGSITKTSIDNLKKANATLKDELNAEMRLTTLTNVQVGSKIAKLQEKGTFYSKQIDVEAKKLSELDAQIEMVQKAISAKRTMLARNEGSSLESLGKQIKQLERKLDKNYQRHNEILCDNKQLKEEIDDLRRERATFDKIYKKLEVDLEEKKRVLGEAFKNSENAKDRKKLSEDQIKKLKLKARKEESDIEKEFQNVLRDINEKNIVDRIEEKFGNLEKRTQVVKKREEESPNKTSNTYMLDESRGFGHELTRSYSKKHHQKSVEKKPKEVEGKTPQEEVEEYRAVFENLKSRTGKSDLREILQLFEDYEKKNYSLYQHLTHLSNEKDELDKQILHVREELNALNKSKNDKREDGADNKNQKIQEIKDSIEDTNRHYRFLEDKQQGLIETINSLKISIPIIFERIGCNAEDYATELIDSTTVNEGNMLQYLAIIEKKTNEILQMYHFSQNRTDAGAKAVDDKGKKGEESIVSGGAVFPEKELLGDFGSYPEKAEFQTMKDFQDYAKEKVKSLIEKKNTKTTK